MNERFLIQRYCSDNHPQVKGEVPFFATGQNFYRYAYRGSLQKHGEHRFLNSLRDDLDEAFSGCDRDDAREFAARALIEEGIVQALWVGHSPVDTNRRVDEAVLQLKSEIPKGPIGESVIEYLSGLGDASHFRSYVSEDQIELVAM